MDDSLILNSKHWAELVSRMVSIRNRSDALQFIFARRLRLAVKMPNVIDAIPFIANTLPKAQFVLIVRHGRDVVKSVVEKGWFSDQGLQDNWYPYKVVGGMKIPHLVEDHLAREWANWNAVTRACYLWRRDADFARILLDGELRTRVHFVSYERFVSSPEDVMSEISTFLAAKFTDLTKTGMMSVRRPREPSVSDCSTNLFDAVDKEQLRLFDEANASWKCF
jgi:hypothetical protein